MRTRELKRFLTIAALAACMPAAWPADAPAPGAKAADRPPTIAARTAAMRHMPGLLTLHWDEKSGKLYLEIPHLDTDLLYLQSLPYGVGSNDLGLDRGQVARARIVRFERIGPRVLLVEPNQDFRSVAGSAPEQLAVTQSFPESVLAGFKVEAEAPAAAGTSAAVLVDATDFFVRDAHNVAETLARSKQDAYKLDPARSAIALDGTAAFPRNVEVEAILTFATDSTARSRLVDDVTPDAHALTVREHQAFAALPGPGFVPRRFDPRAGFFDLTYRDYTAPLGAPIDQQLIVRHRLIKEDPACTASCKPVAPIRYYIDRGAPEPIRSALLEGARWWDQAFQAAGWAPGTFQVELLPAGADPMDDRYNIVQWVHRYTRGWSYGFPVSDPRTGEIIKGNVTLGSLRGRQDYLIAEALLAPYGKGGAASTQHDPMAEMVLARLRLLAAHEVGHTLGLAHNFAASAWPHTPAQSVSVMDYPHPWITLDRNGAPDLSQAYPANIGDWDKVSIDYGYRQFASPADEAAGLERILRDSARTGLVFITDADARAVSSAHPYAHMWDNGDDPAVELERLLAVRAAALARFGENAIRPGAPMAQLEDTLVPLYLLQRYQVDAAVTEIGGLDYRYQLRGDGSPGPAIVRAELQQRALTAVLKTLAPEFLTLPESLLKILPPRPPGLPATREAFPARTAPAFDPIAAAECAADLTLADLFTPQRAARLVEYSARDPKNLTLEAVIDGALATTGTAPHGTGLVQAVQRAVFARTVEALLRLAADKSAAGEVRAITQAKLVEVRRHADSRSATDAYLAHRIDLYLGDPAKFAPAEPVEAPPGMPIGADE
ncbi:MAG TPA: zinc-dependent metalloprotease [Steroidobacteraceae bacterium]|nr:zinc-dependent metalloprotease [Steroidobacteraceae bacterium]